jgi:anaphase-promoting complex subunit 2
MELKKGESLEYGQDEDFEEPVCVEHWQPRKRHPELQDTGFSGLDILALLVSIYGSTDVFVKEYRTQLGSKLLANQNYSIDEDMATLEHLKKRYYYNVNNILSSFLLLLLSC